MVIQESDHSIGVVGFKAVRSVVLEVIQDLLGNKSISALDGMRGIHSGLVSCIFSLQSVDGILHGYYVKSSYRSQFSQMKRVSAVVDGLDTSFNAVIIIFSGVVSAGINIIFLDGDHSTVDFIRNSRQASWGNHQRKIHCHQGYHGTHAFSIIQRKSRNG